MRRHATKRLLALSPSKAISAVSHASRNVWHIDRTAKRRAGMLTLRPRAMDHEIGRYAEILELINWLLSSTISVPVTHDIVPTIQARLGQFLAQPTSSRGLHGQRETHQVSLSTPAFLPSPRAVVHPPHLVRDG